MPRWNDLASCSRDFKTQTHINIIYGYIVSRYMYVYVFNNIIHNTPQQNQAGSLLSSSHTHTSRRHEARASDTTVVQRACTHHYATRFLFPSNMYMVVAFIRSKAHTYTKMIRFVG